MEIKRKKLQYKDLDLKSLREKCGLDFAHFTYERGMCSCCYGPSDLPAKYWKDGKVKDHADSYILFKNADNGSGHVKRNDYLSDRAIIYISWDLKEEQLDRVLEELDRQVGSEFEVRKPLDKLACIALVRKDTAEEYIKMANLDRSTVPFKNTGLSTAPSVKFLNPSST